MTEPSNPLAPIDPPKHELPVGDPPPAFGCLVYIAKHDRGVAARVANLDGIEVVASDERAALGKIVPLFRTAIAAADASGEAIQLLDPPHPKRPDEIKRFLPVHL